MIFQFDERGGARPVDPSPVNLTVEGYEVGRFGQASSTRRATGTSSAYRTGHRLPESAFRSRPRLECPRRDRRLARRCPARGRRPVAGEAARRRQPLSLRDPVLSRPWHRRTAQTECDRFRLVPVRSDETAPTHERRRALRPALQAAPALAAPTRPASAALSCRGTQTGQSHSAFVTARRMRRAGVRGRQEASCRPSERHRPVRAL